MEENVPRLFYASLPLAIIKTAFLPTEIIPPTFQKKKQLGKYWTKKPF
jgi:hypothetical protein